MSFRSLLKYDVEASAKPLMVNDPRCPRSTRLRIELEDLLLAEFLLELERDHDLRQLALDGFFRRQKERARKLHGDRRAALLVALARDVDPERLGQAKEVDAAMLEEAAVFDGENRVHHHFRNLVVLDHLALGALLRVKQGSD